MNITTILRKALHEAEKSTHRYKLGAIIFKQGKVISKGFNKTNRGVSYFGRHYWEGSLHAEISAIINAKCNVAGSSLFVARRNSLCARPCVSCLAAIKEAGIKDIFYTNRDVIIKEKL